jgi:hypothetical protein
MELALKRRWLTEQSTVGELYVDGVRECFILEDLYRPPPELKVRGSTCIPVGRYEVQLTHSPKFGRTLPLLVQVPDFEGVRIHPGNYPTDTEGCLLPGQQRLPDAVQGSRLAFEDLWLKLLASRGAIWLTITVEPAVDSTPICL